MIDFTFIQSDKTGRFCRQSPKTCKTLHIVEERGRVLDWAKTWPVFQAWLKVEFPGITMVKGAAKRLFDGNLNGLYATHRDKVTGKTPLGWKGYRLIENVTHWIKWKWSGDMIVEKKERLLNHQRLTLKIECRC